MARNLMEEIKMENIEIKEEIQEEILPSSTVEDLCTVYKREEIPPSSTVEDLCTVYIKEEISPSSTVEDLCTVYIKEEDVKNESQGKL